MMECVEINASKFEVIKTSSPGRIFEIYVLFMDPPNLFCLFWYTYDMDGD